MGRLRGRASIGASSVQNDDLSGIHSPTEYFLDDEPAEVMPLTFDEAIVQLKPREAPGPKFMQCGARPELCLVAKAFGLGTEETFNIE